MKSQVKHKTPPKKATSAAPKPTFAHMPSKHRPTGPGKTFHKDGHWIENPRKNSVITCDCGNRYLKTRHAQTKCLTCISQGR